MFSKDESEKLRTQFWTSFGKSFPKKWLLYNTKIKGFAFKFFADRKKAMVCLDIDMKNTDLRLQYYNKMLSLKNILTNQYIKDIIFDDNYILDNGKSIIRIYIPLSKKFSIHNKNSWRDAYEFFVLNMNQFELFWYEYEDFIKS
ncbi:MAG TPA: DUF4268 domain-containing protein [Flavobacteriaceae bacterium]|nr:DUF4268 domain-containing protein [Flavobacteriaceae bacterium]